MAVSRGKGGNFSLSKEAPGLTEITVGLGWDPRVTDGTEFDLDASIFIVGEHGKVLDDSSFIFYNNKKSADGSVEHLGDNRSGAGEGGDESATVNPPGPAAAVKRLALA
ncbi:chemical-damaging agent resistance protein C, partial [Pseudomonas syringae]